MPAARFAAVRQSLLHSDQLIWHARHAGGILDHLQGPMLQAADSSCWSFPHAARRPQASRLPGLPPSAENPTAFVKLLAGFSDVGLHTKVLGVVPF